MKFVSETFLSLKSGSGGNGIIAWRRESRTPKGGPAGGNGGNGGSIFIVADVNSDSLFHLRNKHFLQAEDGQNGRNKMQHGRNGEDLYVKVPLGTNIYNKDKTKKLAELLEDKEIFLACKGGRGGKGNFFFKSSQNPAPLMYERGDISNEIEIFLELECISDVGFLGHPNAGKSTLLSVISNAKPKIASFPFTTLIPVLGAVVFEKKKLIFSDIPGIIKNASEGQGLGFEFLKHLNRCKILIHVADISSTSLFSDIDCIRNELKKYSETLYQKPFFLCLNKIDILEDKKIENIKENIRNKFDFDFVLISAKTKKNINIFLKKSFEFFEKNNFFVEEVIDYLEISDDPDLFSKFEIEKIKDIWVVKHPFLKYWIHKIPADTDDNRMRLFKKIEKLELKKQLFKLGAKENEEVNVYNFSFFL